MFVANRDGQRDYFDVDGDGGGGIVSPHRRADSGSATSAAISAQATGFKKRHNCEDFIKGHIVYLSRIQHGLSTNDWMRGDEGTVARTPCKSTSIPVKVRKVSNMVAFAMLE